MSKRLITSRKSGPVFSTYPGANLPPVSERKKISAMWAQMNRKQRASATQVLHRHINACRKQGVKLEKYEIVRTLIEACEMALAGTLANLDGAQAGSGEPRRAYDVYTSPVE